MKTKASAGKASVRLGTGHPSKRIHAGSDRLRLVVPVTRKDLALMPQIRMN